MFPDKLIPSVVSVLLLTRSKRVRLSHTVRKSNKQKSSGEVPLGEHGVHHLYHSGGPVARAHPAPCTIRQGWPRFVWERR